jgi:threonine dehydrogenase-like Zn-dependent dehydrogenase
VYRDPVSSRTAAFFDAVSKSPRRSLQLLAAVRRMSVAIVGCGGIGSAAAFLLASLQVRALVLIDADVVELSNLNRQFLYTRESIGKKKASELRRALLRRFAHTRVTAVLRHYPSKIVARSLRNATHIVCTGDSPPDLFALLAQVRRRKQQFWSAGYVMGVSTVRRQFRTRPREKIKWLMNDGYFGPSIGFQNMELGAALVSRMVLSKAVREDRTWVIADYRKLLT